MKRILRAAKRLFREACALQPVRPIVLIQSDDWGRVGMPDIELLSQIRAQGRSVGQTPWDYYGAETEGDLTNLGETLGAIRDCDGRPACMTANIIMANADLQRMCTEGFTEFRAIPILEGFPSPWPRWDVVAMYRNLIAQGVIYPALHGYTHFSPPVFLAGYRDSGDFGQRTRCLVELNIPYLASLTPEHNFALVSRNGCQEEFLPELEQRYWVKQGVDLFTQSFGFAPRSTCAPGYRSNLVTRRLWAEQGIRVVQTATKGACIRIGDMLEMPRTVFFEPVFFVDPAIAVNKALREAEKAVAQGKMIVICTHSINYIRQHLNRREESLESLSLLLNELLLRWPDLRFSHDGEVYDKINERAMWFKLPSLGVIWQRCVNLLIDK